MTRINIIPVRELTDQHLLAEYREIFMVPSALRRTLKSKGGFDKSRVSKIYTLNRGHVYHFFNKGLYLKKRYDLLVEELTKRNYNLDKDRKFPIEDFPKDLQNDWEYSKEEMDIARKRIKERISRRPNWYRFYGKKL